MNAFVAAGFSLATSEVVGPSLVEVYPHPALVELAKAEKRLPYKATKTRCYWPNWSLEARRAALLAQWDNIISLLDAKIEGTRYLLPRISPFDRSVTLKSFEDMLDAVVCAWVGTEILVGRAKPHGDNDSAIWIPSASD